jgi:HJR/Mrr/RecB family endonuclease
VPLYGEVLGLPAGGDHGSLTGLADDDHPQYTTTAEAQALVDVHTADALDAHDASAISILDAANDFTAIDVEAALAELQTRAEADDAGLAAHLADTIDAHDASAISVLDALGDFAATDVEGVLAELQDDHEIDVASLAAHLADTSDAHDASAISILDAAADFTATDVEAALAELQTRAEADDAALAAHLADATDAHDASAISIVDGGLYFAATDVEAALQELAARKSAFEIIFDGGGVAITTGIKGYLEVPFTCVVRSWRLFSTLNGSIVVDIWKDTYANFPPLVADTITAAAKPTLAAALKNEDVTLTGWTANLTAGDILLFNVDSATTVQRVTLSLVVERL